MKKYHLVLLSLEYFEFIISFTRNMKCIFNCPDDVVLRVFCFLALSDLVRLDTATINTEKRNCLFAVFQMATISDSVGKRCNIEMLNWFKRRELRICEVDFVPYINDSTIMNVNSVFKIVRKIKFDDCLNLANGVIVQMEINWAMLEELTIANNATISTTFLCLQLEKCSNLQRYEGCASSPILYTLSQSCRLLRTLRIEAWYVTDAVMRILFRSCTLLQSVHLTNAKNITDATITELAQSCGCGVGIFTHECCYGLAGCALHCA